MHERALSSGGQPTNPRAFVEAIWRRDHYAKVAKHMNLSELTQAERDMRDLLEAHDFGKRILTVDQILDVEGALEQIDLEITNYGRHGNG